MQDVMHPIDTPEPYVDDGKPVINSVMDDLKPACAVMRMAHQH